MNAIQKPLPGLKNVLQKPHEAFQGLGSRLTEFQAKLDEDTLLDFAIHSSKRKPKVEKALV
jgi:hypothetical protein